MSWDLRFGPFTVKADKLADFLENVLTDVAKLIVKTKL